MVVRWRSELLLIVWLNPELRLLSVCRHIYSPCLCGLSVSSDLKKNRLVSTLAKLSCFLSFCLCIHGVLPPIQEVFGSGLNNSIYPELPEISHFNPCTDFFETESHKLVFFYQKGVLWKVIRTCGWRKMINILCILESC